MRRRIPTRRRCWRRCRRPIPIIAPRRRRSRAIRPTRSTRRPVAGFTPAVRLRSRSAQMRRQNSAMSIQWAIRQRATWPLPAPGTAARRPGKPTRKQHDKTRSKTGQGNDRNRRCAAGFGSFRTHLQFHRPGVRRLCARRRHAADGSRASDLSSGAAREGVEMSGEPALMSLVSVAKAIAGKKFSSREVTQSCLDRIAQWQPRVNAFLAIEAEEALAAADAADAALAKGKISGPLHGVPLAHKDMYYDAGKVVTCGSKIRRDFVATTTSTALQRLKDAGTVRLGSLQMVEFAYGPTGHNVHYGAVRNPWNVDHITGGSSSGSGSAVAARLTFAALGSD